MAGESGGRSLEETPTWAVAVVCFILVLISIFIEHLIHLIGKWLKKKQKTALYEALEKIKSELMLLGFVSLLLTVGQVPISNICVSKSIGSTWHPCNKPEEVQLDIEDRRRRRRLLSAAAAAAFPGGVRRELAAADGDNCVAKGKVALVSADGIHQLHIFIFVLAVFHVIYSVLTMALGRLKMRRWKQWEKETRTIEYGFSHDPERFRLARDTSFGRRHLSFGTKTPPLLYIVCFCRQFARSVPKVDYLTLRNGFIKAHLAGESQTKFDFQKYIKRSLEGDFKEVVGISPPIWLFAVFFLLLSTHGWYSYMWLPFIPLIIILVVGTKLQVIITKMGLRFEASGGDQVVKGVPVVEPDDQLFWFNRPSLILYLINFVLFQNAFQVAFFVWTWYEFGIKSCFNDHTADMVIRITMGIFVQILCSYVTLPLYALVTQMGSNMKTTIFNEQVAAALRKWHQAARKNIIKRSKSTSSSSSTFMHPIITPSRSPSPSRHLSPLHLLDHHRSDTTVDGLQLSPSIRSDNCFGVESVDQSPSTRPSLSYHRGEASTSYPHESDHHPADELGAGESSSRSQHVIDIEKKEFSFGRKVTT